MSRSRNFQKSRRCPCGWCSGLKRERLKAKIAKEEMRNDLLHLRGTGISSDNSGSCPHSESPEKASVCWYGGEGNFAMLGEVLEGLSMPYDDTHHVWSLSPGSGFHFPY